MEQLVDCNIWRSGWRCAHFMGAQPPDASEAMRVVPGEAFYLAEGFRYFEEEIGMHHFYLTWPAREAGSVMCAGGRKVRCVFWYVGAGETLRLAAELAAAVFLRAVGNWPRLALVGSMPKDAPASFVVPGMRDGEDVPLDLVAADWVPERFVVVAEEVV